MSIEINLEYSCDSLEEEELWIIFTFSVFMFSKFCTVNTCYFLLGKEGSGWKTTVLQALLRHMCFLPEPSWKITKENEISLNPNGSRKAPSINIIRGCRS